MPGVELEDFLDPVDDALLRLFTGTDRLGVVVGRSQGGKSGAGGCARLSAVGARCSATTAAEARGCGGNEHRYRTA